MNRPMEYPKYSFLISIYYGDNSEYLKFALESMLKQTLPPSEIVVVFDGPVSDSIGQMVEQAAETTEVPFRFIKLDENKGLGEALRVGVLECAYEYIARMDADDICRLNRCEHQLAHMVENNLDLLGGWIEEFVATPGDSRAIREVPCEANEIKSFLKRRNPFNHVTVMFKKSAVLDAGNYQPFYSVEDYWLWARMIANNAQVSNVTMTYVDVRVGNGMQGRRGGLQIAVNRGKLLLKMYQLDLLGRMDLVTGLLMHVGGALLPISMRTYIYKRSFRKYRQELSK